MRSAYFHIDFIRADKSFALAGHGRLQALVVFSGNAALESGEELTAGQVWLFPAAMGQRQCRPTAALAGMLCTLP